MRQLGAHELILPVAGRVLQALVQISFAAQVNDVHAGGQLGQRFAQDFVDTLRAQAAAGHQQDRLFAAEAGHGQAFLPGTAEELRPHRGAGHFGFGSERFRALGEGRRDAPRKARAKLVG